MIKTRRFQHGRFNYSIDYKQYVMKAIDEVTGEESKFLAEEEVVKYYEFPFTFGKSIQWGPCDDTGEYYRS